MEFRIVSVRPRRRRVRSVLMALALVVVAVPAFSLTPRVETVEAVTYGAWSAWRYFAIPQGAGARDDECDMSRAVMNSVVGPPNPAYANIGCRQALRFRKANVNATAWADIWIEIDNVGPFGGYGQRLRALVSWSGTLVKSQEPICNEWGFLVTVTREACKIIGNNSTKLFLRADYKVGWTFLWANVQAGRGAQIDISNVGWIGPVMRWP